MKQPATLVGAIAAIAILAYQEQGLVLVLVCLAIVPLCVFPIRYVGKKLVTRAEPAAGPDRAVTNSFTENLARGEGGARLRPRGAPGRALRRLRPAP